MQETAANDDEVQILEAAIMHTSLCFDPSSVPCQCSITPGQVCELGADNISSARDADDLSSGTAKDEWEELFIISQVFETSSVTGTALNRLLTPRHCDNNLILVSTKH